MARFKSILIFTIVIVVFDRTIGGAFKRLYFKTQSGEGGGLINYALTKNPDILVLGSSRAKHHVDSAILSKEFSATVYNAGINGQDFLYAAMLLDVRRLSNTPPKIILLHVDRESLSSDDADQNVKVFSYYLDKSELVKKILSRRSLVDRIKYLSMAYRANGKVLPILKNLGHKEFGDRDGFVPLNGVMKFPVADLKPNTPLLPWKVEILKKIVEECDSRGTKLCLFTSPRFVCDSKQYVDYQEWRTQMLKLLISFPSVRFIEIDTFTNPVFLQGRLYKDSSHLNGEGAETFSLLLARKLKAAIAEGQDTRKQ